MDKTPFDDVFQFITFYNECHPARARSLNLLEPEGGRVVEERLLVNWEMAAFILDRVLCQYHPTSPKRLAFQWWYLIRRGERNEYVSRNDIARRFGRDERTIKRWVREVREEL